VDTPIGPLCLAYGGATAGLGIFYNPSRKIASTIGAGVPNAVVGRPASGVHGPAAL